MEKEPYKVYLFKHNGKFHAGGFVPVGETLHPIGLCSEDMKSVVRGTKNGFSLYQQHGKAGERQLSYEYVISAYGSKPFKKNDYEVINITKEEATKLGFTV